MNETLQIVVQIFTEDQQTPTNNKLEPPTASES